MISGTTFRTAIIWQLSARSARRSYSPRPPQISSLVMTSGQPSSLRSFAGARTGLRWCNYAGGFRRRGPKEPRSSTSVRRGLQTAPNRLTITGDRVELYDEPAGPSLDFAAIARGAGGELTADATFTAEHMTYPYGVHLAQVRIERDSAAIAVERFFVGYDVGRAVNPMLVEGQIAGGAAQGIGAALLEEFVYDGSGQPQSVTLADYLMPTIAEIPAIEVALFEDAPTPLNPLGVKGAGEAGIAAAGAAIAAAVDDALGRVGAVRRLPITPNRLHALMAELAAAELAST
jgi:aerobic carbon-monoxide dehydrogenase large subunit